MIGPTFASEIKAAGLNGLPFSWNSTGIHYSERITRQQKEAIEGVLSAHDPKTPAPDPKSVRRQAIDSATTVDQLKVVLKDLLAPM